jgi:hypothetical protein
MKKRKWNECERKEENSETGEKKKKKSTSN